MAVKIVTLPSLTQIASLLGQTFAAWCQGVQANLVLSCTGTPENQVVADIGRICVNTTGGVGTTMYVKEANSGLATGWAAK